MGMMKKRYLRRRLSAMLCAVMAFASMPGTFPAFASENPDERIIVSMGDSYSSGEGIEPFYGQDKEVSEKVNDPDWLAHRSKKSWPGRLTLPGIDGPMRDHRDENWFFVAESGAKTEHLDHCFAKDYNYLFHKGRVELDPQFEIFDRLDELGEKPDYVTLTIGGNDVNFSEIIQSCVLGSVQKYWNLGALSDKINTTWDNFYEDGGIREDIRDAYVKIAEKAGSEAHILVAGYPKLLNQEGLLDKVGAAIIHPAVSDTPVKRSLKFLEQVGPVSKKEAEIVNTAVSDFNAALNDIVTACKQSGIRIDFVPVEDGFDGHEAYSKTPYINKIMFGPEAEDINWSGMDLIASKYSVHPNEKGAEIYAECVQEKINELEAEKASFGDSDLSNNPEVSEEDMEKESLRFAGVVVNPEDIVLKFLTALQDGDYQLAVKCYDPATEQQLDFLGNIASVVYEFISGEHISWGQMLLESFGATDIEVIDCYSYNKSVEANTDILNRLSPYIPGLRDIMCTDADVRIRYRFRYDGKCYIEEETCHVKRYGWSGWRIEEDIWE